MLKPVWRMNTGKKPNDRYDIGGVCFFNGTIQKGYEFYNWSLTDGGCYPIYAYQTSRMREAKRKAK